MSAKHNQNLLPFKALLFGSFALYLYKAHKRGEGMGKDSGTRFHVDKERLIHSVMPWVTTNPVYAPIIANCMDGLIDSFLGKRKIK
jgi:hypothetical protein